MSAGFSTAEYGTREYYEHEAALDFHGTTNGIRCCTLLGQMIHRWQGWSYATRSNCRKCNAIDWLKAHDNAEQGDKP